MHSWLRECFILCFDVSPADGLAEITPSSEVWLFDWRKYLQHTQRDGDEHWPPTPEFTTEGAVRGNTGYCSIIRYRMKEWDALERKKRRMWESEFIQHFDESGFFTGIMLNMKPSGFWTYCWWALLSTALSYVKKNPWCQNLISDVVVWFYYTEYAQWPSIVMFSWKDVLYV